MPSTLCHAISSKQRVAKQRDAKECSVNQTLTLAGEGGSDEEALELSREEKRQCMRELRLQKKVVVQKKRKGKEMLNTTTEETRKIKL